MGHYKLPQVSVPLDLVLPQQYKFLSYSMHLEEQHLLLGKVFRYLSLI